MRYFLSLGSNLGDREKNLAHALSFLQKQGVKIFKISSIYETQPVDIPSEYWFYNQVAEVQAAAGPEDFLALIKSIEQKMGRKAEARNANRIIDIDILLAERKVIQTEELEIPHPRMEKRNFVLIPLMEISPDAVHPTLGETIRDLWKKSSDNSIVVRLEQE
jgi:2-amino-4-hydroxy-6-hydroxymethyldihydropteridine diphosphokinase